MERQWWQDKVCYQIWPKSFKDSNGDGVGVGRFCSGRTASPPPHAAH